MRKGRGSSFVVIKSEVVLVVAVALKVSTV